MTEDADRRDRYVSFKGIDCDGDASRLIARLRLHLDHPAVANPFWERFRAKLAAAEADAPGAADVLYLVCSHVAYLAEVFELVGDEIGASMLEKLEFDCC